ncbi:MAG: BMP family ABC transporter substrate-binding protein [Ottowia sp.]
MIDLNKRTALRLAALSAAALTLAACGKKEEAAAPAPAPAPAAAAAPAAAEPLKAAWIYVGPVGDGGWSFAHDNARKAVQKEFGDKIVTSFVENVPEGADTERVARDLVAQGNKLIFGTSFGFMEPMVKVAADNPGVKFEHATGYKSSENMRTYDSRTYEGAYMAGVIAGAMTKSNVLGVVATGADPRGGAQRQQLHAGRAADQPQHQDQVVWINEWHNPPKETEAATSLINGGADAAQEHRLALGAQDRRVDGQARLRLGLGHDRLRAQGAPGLGHHQLGALVYKKSVSRCWTAPGKPAPTSGGASRKAPSTWCRWPTTMPAETKAKLDEVKAGLKAPTTSGRARCWTTTARKCWPRTRSPTTSSWAASTSSSRASKARCPAPSKRPTTGWHPGNGGATRRCLLRRRPATPVENPA